MILGKVIGHVWATKKHVKLEGKKLLLVRPYFWYNPPQLPGPIVAADTLDAGVGEDVVLCLGAPSRWELNDSNLPIEASVMAIVDYCEIAGIKLGAAQMPQKVQWKDI